jgi:hypothetical protein
VIQRLLDEGGPTGHIPSEGEMERTLLARGREGPFIAIVAQNLTRFGPYDVNTVLYHGWRCSCRSRPLAALRRSEIALGVLRSSGCGMASGYSRRLGWDAQDPVTFVGLPSLPAHTSSRAALALETKLSDPNLKNSHQAEVIDGPSRHRIVYL